MALNISHKTHPDNFKVFDTYLRTAIAIKQLMDDKDICWSYLSMFLFFKYNSQVYCTSIIPGCFNPYNFDYKLYYFERVYKYGVLYLTKQGYIRRVKSGNYSFTEKGNGLYMSFVRLMDHKLRGKK